MARAHRELGNARVETVEIGAQHCIVIVCGIRNPGPPTLEKIRLANHLPGRTWGPSRWGGASLVGRIRPFEGRLSGPPRRGCDHEPVLLLLLLLRHIAKS